MWCNECGQYTDLKDYDGETCPECGSENVDIEPCADYEESFWLKD